MALSICILFFFATENQIYLTNSIKVILLIPLLLISIFSYKYIEVIFRKSDLISTKKFYTYFTLVSFILLFISYISIKNNGYINRLKISQDQKNFIVEFNKDRVAPIDQKIVINNSKKNYFSFRKLDRRRIFRNTKLK